MGRCQLLQGSRPANAHLKDIVAGLVLHPRLAASAASAQLKGDAMHTADPDSVQLALAHIARQGRMDLRGAWRQTYYSAKLIIRPNIPPLRNGAPTRSKAEWVSAKWRQTCRTSGMTSRCGCVTLASYAAAPL